MKRIVLWGFLVLGLAIAFLYTTLLTSVQQPTVYNYTVDAQGKTHLICTGWSTPSYNAGGVSVYCSEGTKVFAGGNLPQIVSSKQPMESVQ